MPDLIAILEQANQLTPGERKFLAEAMLESLQPIDPKIEELWAAESEARYEAYKRGELKAVDWEDLKREIGR